MELRKTNSFSCVLDAFAYVTGIKHELLIEAIGHDGNGRGVPTQQIVSALLDHEFSVTCIERNPSVLNPITKEIAPVDFNEHLGGSLEGRWLRELSRGNGVLIGQTLVGRRLPHAVPWLFGDVIGPHSYNHPSKPDTIRPHVFFRVDKITCP